MVRMIDEKKTMCILVFDMEKASNIEWTDNKKINDYDFSRTTIIQD